MSDFSSSEIPNSSDCISRQDALDAIKMLLEQSEDDEHDKTWNNAIRGSINAIKHHVPSAQPEQPEIQDILDYLDTVLHPIVSPEHWSVYSELYDMVSMLPSVQLEREPGEWERKSFYDDTPICSKCGADLRKEKQNEKNKTARM